MVMLNLNVLKCVNFQCFEKVSLTFYGSKIADMFESSSVKMEFSLCFLGDLFLY